ncbi:MAG: dynamin family protein [Streptosporangiaceae bacterium]
MGLTGSDDALATALEGLAALAGPRDRAALAGLRDRLGQRRLRVLVAGEAKRGKSTLVNALLGRPVLPSGVTPLTALATVVRYGRDEGVTAVFRDGRIENHPLPALDDLVTERGNPGNRRGVASVTVTVESPVLARGAELVDTPGTGSVYAHNTAEAELALETMDAAVFVLTADPPVSASERDLMSKVARLSVSMFVVLNKADYLSAGATPPAGLAGGGPDGQHSGELAEALEFTAGIAAAAAGRPVRVYPLSARAALAGVGDPGFAAFAADFAGYLDSGRDADLRLSVAGHAERLARGLLDEVNLTRRAARMRTGEAAGRVAAFRERLAAVGARRQEAADLARAESSRLLAALNEAADEASARATRRVIAALDGLVAGDLRTAPAAEVERAGRARLDELAVAGAEAWRQEQTVRLEEGLARLDERLAADLRTELDKVRQAAADLLGLALAVPGPGDRLVPDLRFFYVTGEQAGQTELLAGVIRRRLPGQAGRRRAREHLRREAASLVPRQIGRARADLQYRLAETTRTLIRDAEERYTDSTSRLENALRAATDQWQATDADAASQDRELVVRQQELGRLLALLAEVSRPSAATSRPPRSGDDRGGPVVTGRSRSEEG